MQSMRKRFAQSDQGAFAELSGDFNPMHVDPQIARRLIHGRCVVHGVHAVLWALDCWLSQRPDLVVIRRLVVQFQSPICVGDTCAYEEDADRQEGSLSITLRVENRPAVKITGTIERPTAAWTGVVPPAGIPSRHTPVERDEETLASLYGRLDVRLDQERLAQLLPHVATRLPGWQAALVLSTSRLVGMESPGMHSVFIDLALEFRDAPQDASHLEYAVDRYDERLNLLTMSVAASGTVGLVKALVRGKPVDQPRTDELRQLVAPDEFAGRRALVVGGSRGLGETTAKLLAAGGAEVHVTYRAGAADAERVVLDIRSSGGSAESTQLNVEDISSDSLEGLERWNATDLYYFATPPIKPTPQGRFSRALFETYCRVYLAGFIDCFYAMPRSSLIGTFYPSSVFVTEKPKRFSEYAAAKSAGETLCASLAALHEEVAIYAPRLPRLATDQTSSREAAAAPVVLQHLRAHHGEKDRDSARG